MEKSLNVKRVCENLEHIDAHYTTVATTDVQHIDLYIIQTEGICTAKIVIEPLPFSKSKININIFAEGTAKVDCVCNLVVPKEVEGVETDIQMRSWPFDRAKISARPEMFIGNSNIVATHGNALGSLNEQQKYYLMTRGLINYKNAVKYSLLEHA